MSDLEDVIAEFWEEFAFVIQQVKGTYLEDEFYHKIEVTFRILRSDNR